MFRFTIMLGVFWLILAIMIFVSQFLIPSSIEVNWETESEFDTVGFNVLRSDTATGQFTRINDSIIPGSADPVVGGTYQFVDSNVEPGRIYYYRLEDHRSECRGTTLVGSRPGPCERISWDSYYWTVRFESAR